jgi:hypothetical protein
LVQNWRRSRWQGKDWRAAITRCMLDLELAEIGSAIAS